jgi:anti-sigma regulatory factor (Ser/Thr protein kinase)
VILDGGLRAAGAARAFTAATLADWGLHDVIDDAVLVASELVTNAVKHGPGRDQPGTAPAALAADNGARPTGPCLELTWRRQPDRVVCLVTDQIASPPRLGADGQDAESGRGLRVVAALAADWGWLMLDARRKAVWAALAIGPGA